MRSRARTGPDLEFGEMVKTRLWIVSRPGELSNCGLQEEDGGGKEEAKDENEDGEATPAGESQVRQSGEGEKERR